MPNPNRPAEEAERSAVAVEVVVARGAAEVVTFVRNSLVTLSTWRHFRGIPYSSTRTQI